MKTIHTSYTYQSPAHVMTTEIKESVNPTDGKVIVESRPKILVLTPDLRNICGVSNYFNTINLDENIRGLHYFFVNTIDKENSFLKLKRLFVNYWVFMKKLRREKYDLIHINPSLNTNSFLRDGIFCLITILFEVKFIIFFRGWEDKFEEKLGKSFLLKLLFNHSYRRCTNFIILGQSFKDKLIRLGVDRWRTNFWIESTVANSAYLSELSLENKFRSYEGEINVLFLSRIVKSKGTVTAIDAFDIVRKNLPHLKIKLIIAGDGDELTAVKEHVENNKVASVYFLGFVKGEAKKEVLLNSHILLFPTVYGEGLPNCILEAMLYGMPVISRYNGAISDVVTHEENGFLTDSIDPVVFSDFLKRLIEDRELYQKIATNNHLKALESFTKEKVKNRVLGIYNGLLENKKEKYYA